MIIHLEKNEYVPSLEEVLHAVRKLPAPKRIGEIREVEVLQLAVQPRDPDAPIDQVFYSRRFAVVATRVFENKAPRTVWWIKTPPECYVETK